MTKTLMMKSAALAIALSIAGIAQASAAGPTMQEKMACRADAQTLCADEIPDREKVYSCLVKKVNDLSPACKKIISASIGPVSKGRK